MMVWLDQVDEKALRVFVRHCKTPVLVSTLDGGILWANEEFCHWSGYTLGELQRMGWLKLSVPDENLAADMKAAEQLDAYNLTYSVQKQYIPKNDKPQWGTLTVLRYPPDGKMQFAICTWEPLKNGTATAFSLAMSHIEKLTKEVTQFTSELRTVTHQDEEDRFLTSTVDLIRKYPKTSWAIFIGGLGVFGLNNLVQLFTGLNIAPIQKVQQVEVVNPVKTEPAPN